MILRVSPAATSLASSNDRPGPTDKGYNVKITDIPEGVSRGQVILLFTETSKAIAEKEKRYTFSFSELCPSFSFFNR